MKSEDKEPIESTEHMNLFVIGMHVGIYLN